MAALLGVGSVLEDVPLAGVTEELSCSTPTDNGTRSTMVEVGATALRDELDGTGLTASDDGPVESVASSEATAVVGEGNKKREESLWRTTSTVA